MWTHRRQGRQPRDVLDRMSTEELQEILRLDSYGVENYSTQDILYILDLIAQREEETGKSHVDVDAAWSRFQQEYLHQEAQPQANAPDKVRRWKRLPRSLGATAAALVLVCVGLLTAHAAGWDIFGGLAQWNDDVFTFGSLEPEDPPVEVSSEGSSVTLPEQWQETEAITPEILEYDTLQEALDACGITEVKAPTWLPEGCQFQTAERICSRDGLFYEMNTTYEYQGKSIVLGISSAAFSRTEVQKVEGPVDMTDMHGQTVYIIENINNFTIAWEMGQFEYYLIGPERAMLTRMAASMLEGSFER